VRNSETATAVAEWLREQLPALKGSYDFVTGTKTEALPDVMVEVTENFLTPGADVADEFPWADLQQVWLDVRRLELAFMVGDATVDPDDEAAVSAAARVAHHTLLDLVDDLKASLRDDPTLGDRVQITSPRVAADFTPPFAEYQDGTRGREATVTIATADLVEGSTP